MATSTCTAAATRRHRDGPEGTSIKPPHPGTDKSTHHRQHHGRERGREHGREHEEHKVGVRVVPSPLPEEGSARQENPPRADQGAAKSPQWAPLSLPQPRGKPPWPRAAPQLGEKYFSTIVVL